MGGDSNPNRRSGMTMLAIAWVLISASRVLAQL